MRQGHFGTKKVRTFVAAFFAAVIIIADICLIFSHNKTFSENENRVLQGAPALTAESLASGKFMTLEEDFAADQFFLRDAWISLKLTADRITGKVESNGVYLGKNGYLLEIPDEPSQYFERNLSAIKNWADAHSDLNIVMTAVPPSVWVCDQLRPVGAPCIDIDGIIETIKDSVGSDVDFVDVTETLKAHKTEEIYYKSDHHFKSLGAKYVFEAMIAALDIERAVSDYAVLTVTGDFTGTLASNSGATSVKDSIEIYIPLVGVSAGDIADMTALYDRAEVTASAEDMKAASESALQNAVKSSLSYVVEYVDSTEKSATIYKSSALEQKDKYQVFLGGNHPLINITTSTDNGRNLLLIKDSYANTFIQFLLPYYSTITIVDPRYYSDDLEKLISDNSITDVLFFYSENAFVTDNSLFGVLEG